MLYMFLLYAEPGTNWPADMIDQHLAFFREVSARGAYVASEALGPDLTAAATVRVRHGKAVATDGPFAETKEILGGYYLLDCRDREEALEYARKIPDAKYGSVEVRPVVHVADWPYAQGKDRRRHLMGA